MGAPNMVVRYEDIEDGKSSFNIKTSLRGSIAFTKQKYKHNLVYYHAKTSQDEKAKYLLKSFKYLVGIDRGEKTLLYATVYDLEEGRIVDSFSLGDKYKSKIDELKLKQKEERGNFKTRHVKLIDKKISGTISDMCNKSISRLTQKCLEYSSFSEKEGKSTAIIFEYLPKKLGRRGKNAYVELRQMGKLIDSIKAARNFYDLPFSVFEVGAAYTSQICSNCGVIESSSRSKEDTELYRCIHCGHLAHADKQASFNILCKWMAKEDAKSNKVKFNKDYYSRFVRELREKSGT